MAAANDLQLGDKIDLDLSGRAAAATLVGTLSAADGGTQQALDDIIFTDIASAQEMLGMHGRLSHIDLIVADDSTLAAIAALLTPAERIETAAAQGNAIRQMTAAFELNLSPSACWPWLWGCS